MGRRGNAETLKMRTSDRPEYERLDSGLNEYARRYKKLPGIANAQAREALLLQLLDSLRRVRYVSVICKRPIHDLRADPTSTLFDPLRAAILHQRSGDLDEACWLVFLFVHFGKHPRGGWRYAAEVYGRLGDGECWSWNAVQRDPRGFRTWLGNNESTLTRPGAGFGNHRKYQSMSAHSALGTGAAVESYIAWIAPPRTHAQLFNDALATARNDRRAAFGILYNSMDAVASFGRTARFDYLTMIGKMNIADLSPPCAYLDKATGPLSGARLLIGGSKRSDLSPGELERSLADLDGVLHVGMQVLEDCLCNWQKTPDRYTPFRG
jgi:hypothetical protein